MSRSFYPLIVLCVLAIACGNRDADGDGYTRDVDCDDTNAAIHPNAEEECDSIDNNCDGETDEGVQTLFFDDADGDGFGDPSTAIRLCEAGDRVDLDGDCDDTAATTFPGAEELCNSVDDDCDEDVDEDVVERTYYADRDNDGFGDRASTTVDCNQPDGAWSTVNTDCDDGDAEVNPDADELCSTPWDDDCDYAINEDTAIDAAVWYADADADMYGDANAPAFACEAPEAYVADSTDCDDANNRVHPDTTWFYDQDQDGYGVDSPTVQQCEPPSSFYATEAGDCEPSNPGGYPGAEELCNVDPNEDGSDNNCDGEIDEGCSLSHCGTITADETWGPSGGPHLVTCDVFVAGDAAPKLTILPGTSVQFMSGTVLSVGHRDRAELDIQGTEDAPVVFGPATDAGEPGAWGGLIIHHQAESAVVSYLDVGFAGGDSNYPGSISVVDAEVTLEGVSLHDSATHGLHVNYGAVNLFESALLDNADDGLHCEAQTCLSAVVNNVVTGNGGVPIQVPVGDVGAVADNNALTGNVNDVVELFGIRVTTSATWQDPGIPFHVNESIEVVGLPAQPIPVLTLAPAIELRFAPNTGLRAGFLRNADLVVSGAEPVVFTSDAETPAPGDWLGIGLGPSTTATSQIIGAEVGWATTGIHVRSHAEPVLQNIRVHNSELSGVFVPETVQLSDCELHNNGEAGVKFGHGSTPSATIDGCTMTGNAYPIGITAMGAGAIGMDNTLINNEQDVVRVFDGRITADTTWSDPGIPFEIQASITVSSAAGPTWTLNRGVNIHMLDGIAVWVGWGGTPGNMVALGESEADIQVVEAANALDGWDGLYFGAGSDASMLQGITIRGAGKDRYYPGAIYLRPHGQLSLVDCLIEDSYRYAVNLESTVSMPSAISLTRCRIEGTGGVEPGASSAAISTGFGSGQRLTLNEVTITNNDGYIALVDTATAAAFPSSTLGSSYVGNTYDVIRVSDGTLNEDASWASLDAVYEVIGPVYVEGSNTPLLTIEQGASVSFAEGAGLFAGISAAGNLDLNGVTLTAANDTPTAGGWCGVQFGPYTAGLSTLEAVRIEYAGSTTACGSYGGGAISIASQQPVLVDVEVAHSGSNGVRCFGVTPNLSGVSIEAVSGEETLGCGL